MEKVVGEQIEDTSTRAFSVWLDLFRWLAAFEVLIFHARHRLLGLRSELDGDSPSALFYLVVFLSGFSSAAVMIFFVLSGFLVGGASLRRYRKTRTVDVFRYILDRLTRLWVVLIPVFLITALINGAILNWTGRPDHVPAAVEDLGTVGLPTLICNVAFLQTAFCTSYGGNGALWSLFHEFWYYVSWPFVMVAAFSGKTIGKRVLLLLCALALLAALSAAQHQGPNVAVYFSLWLVGVAAANRSRPFIRLRPWLAGGLLALALILSRLLIRPEIAASNPLVAFLTDLLVGTAFSNLILTMRFRPNLAYPPLPWLHHRLAAFSFSLYCTHIPLLNAMSILITQYGSAELTSRVSLQAYVTLIAACSTCVLFAYVFSLATERLTPSIRRALTPNLFRSEALRQ